MLPCDEVRELAEEYISETLPPARHAEVARHLHVCPSCHRAIEEARLARRVLQDAGAPPPPPRLADRIKMAACTRLSRRPRSLSERALGSPAFLATCASLLCGAVICLLAILKVAYVQPWPPPSPPVVTVVETYRLPARDVAVLAAPGVLVTPAVAPARAASHGRHSLAAVSLGRRSVASRPPAPVSRPPARPTRAAMATARPAPAVSAAPHLPAPTVTLAGVRISRPDALPGRVEVEPASLARPAAHGRDGRLELAPPVAADGPARDDFTSLRP